MPSLAKAGRLFSTPPPSTFLLDEKKHVSGVMTSQGNFFSRHIVYNGSPHTVYERMIRPDAIPEEALKRAKARKFSGRPFVLYLGLNKSAEALGIRDYSVFLPETLDTAKAYQMATSFASLDSCVALCYNLIDPSFSPKDTAVMSFTQMSMKDIWGGVSLEDYYKKKDEVAEKILALYQARMGIDLHPYIEEIEIATPWTFARYNGAPEGAVLWLRKRELGFASFKDPLPPERKRDRRAFFRRRLLLPRKWLLQRLHQRGARGEEAHQ
jgi:phytoene dehydrogenase-like protein